MNKISDNLKFFLLMSKANAVMARHFSSQGLSFGDLAILYAISQAPEERIRRVDLASELGLTASGVTRLLIPLEKIGVIKREANERDARVSYTTLTASGKRMLNDSLSYAEDVCKELIPNNQCKNLGNFHELLKALAK